MATTEPHRSRRDKDSVVTKIRSRLKLDTATVLRMLKGGLPPLIVTAMYQADSVAEIEDTFGYIAAILAVSAQCLMPRAKFIKIVSFSVLSSCVAAGLCCVAVVCCVRARQHSISAGASLSEKEGYNSSASAVSAVWLLLGVWLANAFRSYRPSELQDPMVAASIFMVVTLTNTPSMLTISEGLVFVRRLLVTFLIGLAVAAGVSVLILPITSRRNVFKALNTCIDTIDKLFGAQIAFVTENVQSQVPAAEEKLDQSITSMPPPHIASEKDRITPTLDALRGLMSKMSGELVYTEIEVAWGKLVPQDIVQIRDHMNQLFLPLAGLSMLPEIYQNLLQDRSIQHPSNVADHSTESATNGAVEEPSWDKLTSGLGKRLAKTRELTVIGLRAAFDLLEISPSGPAKRHQVQQDLEKQNAGAVTQSSNPSGSISPRACCL